MASNIMLPFGLPFILDGATGTELLKRGMKTGECTEKFILENPRVLTDLQAEYIAAGSQAVLAPTFGANIPTLVRHGFSKEEADKVCRELCAISKQKAEKVKIGGDLSPTGLLMKPYGNADPQDIYDVYHAQAATLIDCHVDFIFIETMLSAAEAKIAVRAVRDISSDIPVLVSLTVGENGRTVNGDTPGAALLTLVQYNIQGFGCNCSIGPEVVANALESAAPIAKLYGIPLIAKPNAGMPVTTENGSVFPLTPEDMARAADRFTGLGVGVFGGCCGTTPDHIRAIAAAAKNTSKTLFEDVEIPEKGVYVSTSRIYALTDENAKYWLIDGGSEDFIYDLMDECQPDDVLYFELGEGGAETLINMDAFIPNPIALRGMEKEISKAEAVLCRKFR
ncbi:MAG: homocysteine S-methyltransferase family protein [Clostridia bacterium]|nr:homocysteine S-methyltransferase family protein [Clostridia bacterium]